jgi:putative acetyltransferase
MTMVRPERSDDLPAIYAIHASSFPTDAEARLVDSLRAVGRLAVSLVADVDGAVVGHIAFSPVMTATGACGAGLGPVAVAEAHRRRGVAVTLVEAGLEACRAVGFGWAVVLGEPAYYGRFGFRPAPDFGLSDEYGGGLAFQAIEVVPGAMPIRAGLVNYAPEFAALG